MSYLTSRREVGPRKYVLFETQFGRAHRETERHLDLLLWVDTPLDVALARSIRASIAGFLREPARLMSAHDAIVRRLP